MGGPVPSLLREPGEDLEANNGIPVKRNPPSSSHSIFVCYERRGPRPTAFVVPKSSWNLAKLSKNMMSCIYWLMPGSILPFPSPSIVWIFNSYFHNVLSSQWGLLRNERQYFQNAQCCDRSSYSILWRLRIAKCLTCCVLLLPCLFFPAPFQQKGLARKKGETLLSVQDTLCMQGLHACDLKAQIQKEKPPSLGLLLSL